MLKITKNLSPTLSDFIQKFENPRKNIIESANFFCYCFILYKEKMLTEVELEDGRPKSLGLYIKKNMNTILLRLFIKIDFQEELFRE